jgi:glucokinase
VGAVVGVDVGGTKLLAVRLDPDGGVTADHFQASPKDGPGVVEEVAAAARRLSDHAQAGAVGVGVPGLVDRTGLVRFAPNLPGLAGTSLLEALCDALPGWTVWVGNDATAACWAECDRGAARGHDEVLMVTLGTGIGGGHLMDGRLIGGAHGFAGEIGHMVVDPYGPPCPCGKKGCWERFASGNGLGRLAREAAQAGRLQAVVRLAGGDSEAVRGEHVTLAALDGEPEALEVMASYAWWLALGLANLANALDPSVIVLGGGLIEAERVVMGPVRRAFSDLAEAPGVRQVEIVAAQFGERAGAVGAALLAAWREAGRW